MGLGRIVYALGSLQLTTWRREWGLPDSPVTTMPINAIVPAAVVDGPAPALEADLRDLHQPGRCLRRAIGRRVKISPRGDGRGVDLAVGDQIGLTGRIHA